MCLRAPTQYQNLKLQEAFFVLQIPCFLQPDSIDTDLPTVARSSAAETAKVGP